MPKLRDPNLRFQNALKVNEDTAASYWLKNALIEAINRDPVDAAQDAEVLHADGENSEGFTAMSDRRYTWHFLNLTSVVRATPTRPKQ